MSELPKSWIKIPLKDCVYFQEGPGLRKWQFGESGIPFLNIRTLNNGRIDKSKCQFVLIEEFEGKYEHFLLNEGDIIVSSSGTIGKLAVVKSEDLPLMLNTSVIRYRTLFAEHLSQSFLKFYLQSHHFFKQINSSKTGSAIENYGPSHLKEMSILIPPFNEQRRIVAKLEKLLSRVESCRERLEKIPRLLKRFRQSVLAAACSGRLTVDWRNSQTEESKGINKSIGELEIPSTWSWKKLPELGFLGRGKSKHRPRDAEHLYGGKYPFIQTGAIARSNGRITSHKQTYSEAGLAQSKLWKTGTVCITIAANIADSAILSYPACFPDSVVGFIAHPEMSLPKYVEFFIRTARNDLSQFAPATAQKNINLSILNEVLIPTPPLEEQNEIVRRVEALFKFADQIEARYQKAKTHFGKLTQSILGKAFRGELVPQDPNDEPASRLLERIKQTRTKSNDNAPPKHKPCKKRDARTKEMFT